MKKRSFILIVLTLIFFKPALAQTFMSNIPGRSIVSLNGKWQIVIDWYDKGEKKRIYEDTVFNDKRLLSENSFSSKTLNVLGDWNSQKPDLNYFEGGIWYKKEFNYVPQPQKRMFIHFGAINYKAKVYLNGSLLGEHEGGFTPFQFEVGKLLKTGKNKLIVYAENRRSKDGIPALSFDWWNYGGITRDVSLITAPEIFIDNYFIQLKKGTIDQIAGWIKLKGATRSEKIELNIPEAKISKMLFTDDRGYVDFSIKGNIQLWSPDFPKLYGVNIKSSSDQIEEKIGFRNIEVKGDAILLNGKPIFLKGVNLHEEIPFQKRRAVSSGDATQLLGWAKQLGCNFVRLAHYPQNEYIVRQAEAMGLMVWEEVPIWQGIDFSDSTILNKAEFMLKEMVSRDRNRCGVIIWSISNETKPGIIRNRVLAELAAKTRELDPTRLISAAMNSFKYDGNRIAINDPLCQIVDVMSANNYLGWYTPWPDAPVNIVWYSDVKKPIVMSEFGAEAVYGNHGYADAIGGWYEESQQKIIRDNLTMLQKIPNLCGICPWVLADFRSPVRMNGIYQDGWNRKGLLSDKGRRKKAWFTIRDFYKNKN